MDIILYRYPSAPGKNTDLKKRILILKIFFDFFINNKYNFNPYHTNIFIHTKYTGCLEGLLFSSMLKQSNKKLNILNNTTNNSITSNYLEINGIVFESPIEIKNIFNFLNFSKEEKFETSSFFIFGKLSQFINDFFNDFRILKNKFLNIIEWFPEEGKLRNIYINFRHIYLKKLKFFFQNFFLLNSKKRICSKNKDFIQENKNFLDEEFLYGSHKTFNLKFEDDYIKKDLGKNERILNDLKILRSTRECSIIDPNFISDTKIIEKEFDLEKFYNLSFDF